jgi:hypothetical protein
MALLQRRKRQKAEPPGCSPEAVVVEDTPESSPSNHFDFATPLATPRVTLRQELSNLIARADVEGLQRLLASASPFTRTNALCGSAVIADTEPLTCVAARALGGARLEEVLAAFAAEGAHVALTDSLRRGPLHHAVMAGNASAVQVLLRSGADVNAEDKSGETPIFLAARRADGDILKLLREGGGDFSKRNAVGEGVLDVAARPVGGTRQLREYSKFRRFILQLCEELRVAVVYHDACSRHNEEGGHQEAPERMASILNKLNEKVEQHKEITLLSDVTPADAAFFALAPDRDYVDMVPPPLPVCSFFRCSVWRAPGRKSALRSRRECRRCEGCKTTN